MHQVLAAVYGVTLPFLTKRQGGVGSTDESLASLLIKGKPLMLIDNYRGRMDSMLLESVVTAEGPVEVRTAYSPSVMVDPRSFIFLCSSNGVEATRDLANRTSLVRIRKHEPGYEFAEYPEGGLLEHVRNRQNYYYGSVAAILQAWAQAGFARTSETRHDFKVWCRSVDWIVQNIFDSPPLMDGHAEAQNRISNPALTWLRFLCNAVAERKHLGEPLTATRIFQICADANLEIPGLRPDSSEPVGARRIGTLMSQLVGETNSVFWESYRVTRSAVWSSERHKTHHAFTITTEVAAE
jgi:hypothetical protein